MGLNKAILIEKIDLCHDTLELKFKPEAEFKMQAGQFINIKINDGGQFPCFRAYSVSCTDNSKQFEICLKVDTEGRGSNWLKSLNLDDNIEYIGPTGKFLFDEESNNDAFFIATGTGVAPLKCMIEQQLAKGFNKKITLLFGLRHEQNVFYKELFEEIEKNYYNFKFLLTLSRPKENWTGLQGRVTNYLESNEIDSKNTNYYICGLKAMIDEVLELLKNKGISEENIHFEKYD